MTTNLFVVRTPLQLFNAVEARSRFHQGDSNHLLAYSPRPVDIGLIKNMLDAEWASYRIYDFSGMGRYLYAHRLRQWLADLGTIDTAWIGLAKHLPLHVANTISPSRLRLLDDGNETLLIARYISALREGKVTFHHMWRNRLLGINLKPDLLLGADYFSVYDVSGFGIASEKNDYRMFRQKTSTLPVKECTAFIGSNLVNNYFSDEAHFIEALRRVRRHITDKEVYYCPHRYESSALRLHIKELGFELITPSTILERAFMDMHWIPSRIATFRSTAVDTLALIYGIEGRMYEITPKDMGKSDRDAEMRAVYDDYKSRGGMIITPSDY